MRRFGLPIAAADFARPFAGPDAPPSTRQLRHHRDPAQRNGAPKTVANFLYYVKTGHYDSTVFHRVIDNFMIQGGGYTRRPQRKADAGADRAREPKWPDQRARRGIAWHAVATRTPRQRSSSSTSSTIRGSTFQALTATATCPCFGKVVEGMDVVDKIRAVPTESKGAHASLSRRNRLSSRPHASSSSPLLPADAPGASMVHLYTTLGPITIELDPSGAPKTRGKLPVIRAQRLLRRHAVPSRHQRLHDPGRRLRGRHAAEDHRAIRSRTRHATACATRSTQSRWPAPAIRIRRPRSSSSTSPTTTS